MKAEIVLLAKSLFFFLKVFKANFFGLRQGISCNQKLPDISADYMYIFI